MVKPFHIQDWYTNLRFRRLDRDGEPSGVLLLSSGGLGDTVLFALILPRLLCLAGDGESVTVLLRGDAARMSFLLPSQATVMTVDYNRLRKDLGYRRRTREGLFNDHYRLVVSCDFLRHPDLDESLISACQAPETLAMEPRSWPKYDPALKLNRHHYTRLFDSGPIIMDKVVRWSNFAAWLTGSDLPAPLVRLDVPASPRPGGASNPCVLIQPFSAVKQKQSRLGLYRKIIEELPDGSSVILTGGPNDLKNNPEFEELAGMSEVAFNSSTFEELAPLLRSADLVISVDTALMHLSVALGARTLCLASAAYVGEIVPYDPSITPPNAHFIYHSMPCEGCLGSCSLDQENGMFPCVARLEEGKVLAKVRELISPSGQAMG